MLIVPAFAQKKLPEGNPVLVLSGGQRRHRGYRDQAFYLSNLLEDTGRYQVTIVEDAALFETPAMDKYAQVVALADRRDAEFRFSESQQKAITGYVHSGRGFVSIQGADNAPPDWVPAMKDMLGGIYSHTGLSDGKAIMGTFEVKIAPGRSPDYSKGCPTSPSGASLTLDWVADQFRVSSR